MKITNYSWSIRGKLTPLATEFTEAGFTSALNWYRNWQLTAPWEGARYRMPGRYVTGDRDLVYGFPGMDQLIPALPTLRPGIGPGTHPAQLRPLHRRGVLRPGQCDAAGIPGFAEKLTG
ncbi:hypothetical protein OOK58_57420 [Streptomyces sp. NBC_01728]|uniref:hypothetical protein n=1 Tax=unclassified Streptomyces TaxID=2593676 RepID=UPI00224F7AFB|nr:MULTISPECIES: hypothetical protein [unclassified Streptomyces]MCX4460111.1 hypothetical protein [Streptomyces sp. NBC_01719]MCX4500558.1 hypothetical protein [Streptomyces sp. NBC_01728]